MGGLGQAGLRLVCGAFHDEDNDYIDTDRQSVVHAGDLTPRNKYPFAARPVRADEIGRGDDNLPDNNELRTVLGARLVPEEKQEKERAPGPRRH